MGVVRTISEKKNESVKIYYKKVKILLFNRSSKEIHKNNVLIKIYKEYIYICINLQLKLFSELYK